MDGWCSQLLQVWCSGASEDLGQQKDLKVCPQANSHVTSLAAAFRISLRFWQNSSDLNHNSPAWKKNHWRRFSSFRVGLSWSLQCPNNLKIVDLLYKLKDRTRSKVSPRFLSDRLQASEMILQSQDETCPKMIHEELLSHLCCDFYSLDWSQWREHCSDCLDWCVTHEQIRVC